MLAGIAGGFGQALADDQKEKKAWLRDQKMMNRKYAMTTGTASIKETQSKRDAVLRKSKYLNDKGIDNNTLMYIFDESGVSGIDEVYDILQGADPNIEKSHVKGLVEGAKGYASAEGTSFNGVLNNAFGLYKQNPTPDKVEGQNFWQRMFDDPVDRAFKDDGTPYIDGYTLADIYRIQGTSTPMGSGSVKLNRRSVPIARTSRDYQTIKNDILDLTANSLESAQESINAKYISNDPNSPFSRKKGIDLKEKLSIAAADQDYSNLPLDIQEDFLRPYLERESLNRGSVTLNPSIPEALKSQVESMLYPTEENKEEVIEIKQEDIIKDYISVNPDFNVDNIPTYNMSELTEKRKDNTVITTPFYFDDEKGTITLMPMPKKTKNTEKTTNLVTPTDEQFIAFAPSYISANNTERQLKEGRRRSKVLLGKNDIEYTYNEYKKLSGEMAKRRGLPENYEGPDGWDAAPAHRWLIDITKD